jgi:CheY-like chemotaxis protein
MGATSSTLLLVDDGDDNREVLARRLALRGYAVDTARDGEEALLRLEAGPVDLVLLDLMMPGLTGIDVLERIRGRRSETELPVIVVSARTDSEAVVDALARGANDFVTKPVDFSVLCARLEGQLRLRERARPAPAAIESPAPGIVVDGRYVLEQRLGGGAFGAVWRARHLELKVLVALKILRVEVASTYEAQARFRREGISACRVSHPNAVTVLDFSVTESGLPYLVMELLEGTDLDREIRRSGRLSPRRASSLMVPVCRALAAAHARGIIHRDIKPSNIFIHRADSAEIVKVLDFGLAKLSGDAAGWDRLTASGAVPGTVAYVAPERFRGRTYDGRSDVYGVGVTLYEALTGRVPFAALDGDVMAVMAMHIHDPPPPPRAFSSEVPEWLERLVLQALSKDPLDRPNAAEMADALAPST